MKNNNIICDYVKVIGSSHKAKNIPCQDFSISEIYNDHVILINCDGAGSAKKAEIGSQSFAELFLNELKKISDYLKNNPPGEWIIDEIIISISSVRKQIRKKFNTNSLSDYHTTLVAIISGKNGGFICHIGDGYGLAITDKDFFISEPENGEYANETFFATESKWIKHLRITPFGGAIKFLGVMSDGAGTLFESTGKFNNTNLCEFISHLIKDKFDKEFLTDFFSNENAVKKTHDDKSISFYLDKTSDFKSFFVTNNYPDDSNQVRLSNSIIENNNKGELVFKSNSNSNSNSNFLIIVKITLLTIFFAIFLFISFIVLDNFFVLNTFGNSIHPNNSNTTEPKQLNELPDIKPKPDQNKMSEEDNRKCHLENSDKPNIGCVFIIENNSNNSSKYKNFEMNQSSNISKTPNATPFHVDSK